MTSLRDNKRVVGETNNEDIATVAREGALPFSVLRLLSVLSSSYTCALEVASDVFIVYYVIIVSLVS